MRAKNDHEWCVCMCVQRACLCVCIWLILFKTSSAFQLDLLTLWTIHWNLLCEFFLSSPLSSSFAFCYSIHLKLYHIIYSVPQFSFHRSIYTYIHKITHSREYKNNEIISPSLFLFLHLFLILIHSVSVLCGAKKCSTKKKKIQKFKC